MSAERWSEQPAKATPVDADEILVIDSAEPAVQKRATLASVIANVSSPSKLLRVKNQADLKAQFGTTLVIPDGESWTILVLESFDLDVPFNIGNGASLQIIGATINLNITTTAFPTLFVNLNPANPISLLNISNISITGDGTNEIFDIVASFSVIIDRSVLFNNFKNAGTIETSFFDIEFAALQGVETGIIIKNPFGGSLRGFSLNQAPSSPPTTFISIITTNPSQVTVQDNFSNDTAASMIFFDPNAPDGAKLTIEGTVGTPAEVFQQGTDIVVNTAAIGSSGVGFTNFTTATSHGLVVGQALVNADDFTDANYRGTFIVVSVDTPLTGTVYEVEALFTATGAGTMNAASLNETDPKVAAFNNVDTNDSMASAQVGFTNIGTPIVVTITTQDVPVLIGGTQFVSNNLERATATTGGQITNLTEKTKKYPITFSALIEKVAGGSTDIGLLLIKNGSLVLTETFEIPHSVNPGIIQISATRTFELAENDTLDMAVVNFAGTDNIEVSQANISYSENA